MSSRDRKRAECPLESKKKEQVRGSGGGRTLIDLEGATGVPSEVAGDESR